MALLQSIGLGSNKPLNPQPILGLALSFALMASTGCTAFTNESSSIKTAPAAQLNSSAQQLPVTAQAILGGATIDLEVASTPQQQALGLMHRPPLADDRGMLFPFSPPRQVNFWMKNVPVPLDMVFIYQGQIQEVTHSAPPCPEEPCPSYGPAGQPVDYVIELMGGRAEELGLEAGQSVEIVPLKSSNRS